MNGFKDKTFSDRLSTAAEAKKAMLERFRAKPAPDDPVMVERAAARQAISQAREARAEERREAQARAAAEKLAREAAEREQKLADEAREIAERAEREAAMEIERKRARDARYAARKARK